MTLTQIASGDEDPRGQHKLPSGVFIARDNYGQINSIDSETKGWLKKVAKQTPELASKLEHLIKNGAFSPDELQTLKLVSWNINEDVARALLVAGQNINEDVARTLKQAADGIDSALARTSMQIAMLEDKTSELEAAAHRSEIAADKLTAANHATVRLIDDDGQSPGLVGELEAISMYLQRQLDEARQIGHPGPRWLSRLKTYLIWFLVGAFTGAAGLYLVSQ